MFVQTYSTIQTIFTRPSDMPITLERLNATTYADATMKKSLFGQPTGWMFNFLSFLGKSVVMSLFLSACFRLDPEKATPTATTLLSTSFSYAAVKTSTELQFTATLTNNSSFNLSIAENSDPSEFGGLEETESTDQMSEHRYRV
jgi:hypothetical protein